MGSVISYQMRRGVVITGSIVKQGDIEIVRQVLVGSVNPGVENANQHAAASGGKIPYRGGDAGM